MLTILIMILTGLIVGILSAILGIGGGLIMLPAIQIILKFDPATAVATTLLTVVLTSFSGAIGHYRNGRVKVKQSLLIAIGGIVGVIIGSYIFQAYLTQNTDYIQLLLAIMFLIMTIRMSKDLYKEFKNPETKENRAKLSSPIWLVILGIVVGSLTGMLGLGGGIIIVPVMIWLFGSKPIEAVGTTLLAMLPIAIIGAIIKMGQGFVNLNAGLIIGVGSIIGAQIGVKISQFVNPKLFKVIFIAIFIYLATSYLIPIFGF
ncbi:MAG TPA: sulfite exporter TauE/SafE family protein [Syntrophomonadaceae bacterium]|nr:sulfite exporter TauE/SafE family protein [Syntrophomonadaceae bacterium]